MVANVSSNQTASTSIGAQTTSAAPAKNPMKLKNVTDKKVIELLSGTDIKTLEAGGYKITDTNNDGIFNAGDTLQKQVTVMLDAGHGSGKTIGKGTQITIPGVGKYTTQEGDSFESIAAKHKVDVEKLKAANPGSTTYDPGKVPSKEIGDKSEAYLNGVAREDLRKILEQRGYRVLDNVRTPSLKSLRKERRENKMYFKPDVFVSLHCNAGSPSTNGEVVVYNPKSKEDVKFASCLNKALKQDSTFANKSMLKKDDLGVLMGDSKGQIAEALVEMGFITNKQDYDKLNNPATRRQQLEAIADGIDRYYEDAIK